MITPIEINTIMYQVIKASPLAPAVNGKVYRDRRPNNSKKEDVVTNVVTMTGSLSIIQDAVCNINIHVPSIDIGDGPMPDSARFSQLSSIAAPVLKFGSASHFTFYTESIDLVPEQNNQEWFLNFRIRFKQHNNINN
ncbi:MAG: hypothetical protein BGO31_14205 [Bacteroidetes bacterium 43-16]|nr:MAG: hypothetical protein BGO31_14205 [Bacteroidetes bacterium 43-16]